MFSKAEEILFYQRVGDLLRSNRIQADKSQDALASFLGLTRASIANIEKGRQKILIHTLVDAAEFLNISVDKLIPGRSFSNDYINVEMKSKINKKIPDDNQASKLEDFINLNISKNLTQ